MISIKSKNELEMMRAAGEVVALAHEKLKEQIKPGITTLELDRMVEEIIRKHGAIPSFKGYKAPFPGAEDYPASICASVNDEVVHGIPSLKMLKDGDIISIDIGACLNGFHGDAARTYAVGVVSEKALKLIEVTRQSFYEGIKQAVPGNRKIDISSAVQDLGHHPARWHRPLDDDREGAHDRAARPHRIQRKS
jgi:methionyl aminopeptidase